MASRQEFLGVIIDSTGIRPTPPSKTKSSREDATTIKRRRVTGLSRDDRPLAKKNNLNNNSNREHKFPIVRGCGEAGPPMQKKEGPYVGVPQLEYTFLVQTDVSSTEAGAWPLQPDEHEEQVLTFASHRVLKTDSHQGPTELECMAVLWANKY